MVIHQPWQQQQQQQQHDDVTSATTGGPAPQHQMNPATTNTPDAGPPFAAPAVAAALPTVNHHHLHHRDAPLASRSQLRSVSSPVGAQADYLTNARSNPVLLPSQPPGTVRDMASRFEIFDRGAAPADQHPAQTATSRERHYGRAVSANLAATPKSPSASSGEGKDRARLQKRRPQHAHKSSLGHSPATSFEADGSLSSAASASTARTSRSQPHSAFSSRRTHSPGKQDRPLFGEITADGVWNGNFELGNYSPLPTFEKTPRRGSEGSLALGHGRSRSQQDISTPLLPLLGTSSQHSLQHKRNRSDIDTIRPQAAPSMPELAVPALYPTPPDSATRSQPSRVMPGVSRIPISNQRASTNPTVYGQPPASRSASAMSVRRRKLSRSPTRSGTAKGKENSAPTRNRYEPPPLPLASPSQTLPAKIVAPPAISSPPLRSSRPRQPVSSATTSASRARAAERFQDPNPTARDGRRPSEQWLGKPYDAQRERSRRKIPELDKVDFAERRERIQKAITASLKSSGSQESMGSTSRNQSRSRTRRTSGITARDASQDARPQARLGADRREDEDDLKFTRPEQRHARDLNFETSQLQEPPNMTVVPLASQTDHKIFEDQNPVLVRPGTVTDNGDSHVPDGISQVLLAPAIYEPEPRAETTPRPAVICPEGPPHEVQSLTVLDNVMRMPKHSGAPPSRLETDFAEDSLSAEDSPSDLGDKWGLGNGSGADQGSIRIMLDDDPSIAHNSETWPKDFDGHPNDNNSYGSHMQGDHECARAYDVQAYTANGSMESHTETSADAWQDDQSITPRKNRARDDTLRPTVFRSHDQPSDSINGADNTIVRVLDYYQSTGTLTTEMLEEVQHRMVDLHRISANGGSDANMIQSLLESIVNGHSFGRGQTPEKQLLRSGTYEMPMVTPDTPPMDDSFVPGTVIVYGSDAKQAADEDDFEAKIRKADEIWERQQRSDPYVDYHEDDERPLPPPKDAGYTPRSSVGLSGGTFTPNLTEAGLRISSGAALDIKDIHAAGDRADMLSSSHQVRTSTSNVAPQLPSQPPPAPPSAKSFTLPDVASAQAYSERGSSELSPLLRKPWAPSGSSRPSIDSQRAINGFPGSQSMTSFSESTRIGSMDTSTEANMSQQKTTSPAPEQKRLLRRRHIVKELLDTENSYHQDLKIIEDIYKATCTPELVQPEDKKVLFGNCDEVETFALHFYDDMRKAVSQVYTPSKQHRWINRRGSFSTTQSEGTTSTFADPVDDEKDRTTTVGRAFLMNIPQMEQVYTSYLKNHDAANQRLTAIQGTTTVKCWLDECHANASDITSAWDLDSLLVKPTQRVAKYPMLLQQLLEVTPQDHPDYQDLKSAAKDSISMLTRINDAKKRADLVEQIVNPGKRKDSDIRSGLAKAFGRRTEKLKERVGIAEAFQDPEFDDLAHKFGGHFIRLQICMRDVQDYMHRTDKAVELINNYANALELFTDVSPSTLPEIESKFRKYGQTIRDLTLVAFGEHKASVQKRVLAPMIQCIKLHEGPQNAINKRKKRIVDYAKCKSDERRGQKPDKRTAEASDMYVALNEQLKLDLPKLYNLTAQLVQSCLRCFIDIQLNWQETWDKKLKPLLDAADVPISVQQIEPAFRPDFVEIEKRCNMLSICNGLLKIEAASFLSPQTSAMEPISESSPGRRRLSTLDSSKRTLSVGSESSTNPNTRRQSGLYTPGSDVVLPLTTSEARMRSNSARAPRSAQMQSHASSRPWSNSNIHTPSSSFSGTRPATADSPSLPLSSYFTRQSSEQQRALRPASDATHYTARPEVDLPEQQRFSGLFNSALPPDVGGGAQHPPSPSRAAPDDMPVLFVCASLFEFSIDKTRKEGGYPYLQYVQGEVFDVVAQKGELWLAKNQDDPGNELGWIWEQHFIILSSEN